MADDYIRTKDLTVITSASEMNDDKFVASHTTSDGDRETCTFTTDVVMRKLTAWTREELHLMHAIFGTTIPTEDVGQDGDIYYLLSSTPPTLVLDRYIKYEGNWYLYRNG